MSFKQVIFYIYDVYTQRAGNQSLIASLFAFAVTV